MRNEGVHKKKLVLIIDLERIPTFVNHIFNVFINIYG